LGPLMCADFLEMAGFSVRFFGANLPTESLVAMVEHERPDLLGLSVSTSVNVPALERAVVRVREAFGDAVPLAIGGYAVLLAPGIEARLGVPRFGEDARALASTAQQVLFASGG